MTKATMGFLQQASREKIIAACAQLNETISFKKIALKEIGKARDT